MRQRIGRRLISIMLSVLMLVSLLPTAVFAEELPDQSTAGVTKQVGEGNGDTVENLNENKDSTGEEETKGESSTTYVKVGDKEYATLEAAIAEATPDENGVITYEINGKAEISGDQWISFVKETEGVKKVVFAGKDLSAEISIMSSQSILGVQNMDIDVEFAKLTLSHPDGKWVNDLANATKYFACMVRNAGHTVTYTNCTFPNGVCNNQYGKTVFNNCKFTSTTGWNLWNTSTGDSELNGCAFTGKRGVKLYAEGSTGEAGSVKVKGTTFELNDAEKAAVEITKPGSVELDNISVSGTTAGTIKKNLTDGYSNVEKVTVAATGKGISGSFTGTTESGKAKDEFNITAGTFNGTVNEDYLAAGTELKQNEDGTYGVEAAKFIDLDTFIKWLESSDYSVDGASYTDNANAVVGGKLVVKWSPVSGCYDNRGASGHNCTVGNVAATGNTPLKVNSDLAQFSMLGGATNVTVKNVRFVYEAADFTICANSGWACSKTKDDVKTAQLYLQNSGNTAIEGCEFDNVVFTSFDNTGSTTIASCQFKNIYNAYAIKDLGGSSVSVTGSTFENCGGGVMLNSNKARNASASVTITGNTFTKVDVAGTAAEGKAGTRGLIQIAKSGTYTNTNYDFSNNTATNCGPVLRQLNESVKLDKANTEKLEKLGKLYTSDSLQIAKVGGMVYPTLEAAFAALNGTNYTLTLLDESKWNAATPVYWAAGEQSGYAATLAAALTEAYMANGDNITIVCRPGADVGAMTHGHVADNITIYGNNAYLSGGECDLEVDTYMFSRDTGKQVKAGGVYLDKNITINAYELDNLGVWGERHTTYEVNVNLTDCDGKAFDGVKNPQRVYISNNSGVTSSVNNITLKGCDFLTAKTAVFSNANGTIGVDGCSFTGTAIPVNINHDGDGAVTVEVKNSTFTNCGDKGDWKKFAAPIRFVNSGSGTMKTTVDSCTFEGTVGKNGDILIGDGRAGKVSNDLSLTVKNTYGWVQAQKPGRYDGDKMDSSKRVATEVDKDVGLTTSVKSAFIKDTTGTKNDPYTLEQLSEMTRAEYIDAQKRLGDTMYVAVGNYEYDTNGVLGNGVRNDTPGQKPDHSRLNSYAENGYLGDKNDGANGKNIVFVNGSITSNVDGYTSIDDIGTSLLLAVPAYTNVTFEGITFNNVMSFDYQLYTSPWSQLGELKFKNCVFEGIIVGAIAAQELTFDGCRFEDHENSKSENNSNPTWIRPAYGNWTKDDNEGQGTGFRSLTKITFTNNTVTSTRPVKFERIAQWEMATTVTATGNTFTINKVQGDTDTKNVGMYFGANAKFDLVVDNNTAKGKTAGLYTAVYNAPNGTDYPGLPAGSTVKNAAKEDIEITDALVWKHPDKLTLKTTEEVAQLSTTKSVVKFATLQEAINAAANGDIVTLLKDVTENVEIAAGKELTLDLNGCTLNGGTVKGKAALTNYGTITIKDTSAAKPGTIKRDDNGTAGYYVIDNQGTMTIEGGHIYNKTGPMPSGSSLIRNAGVNKEAALNITGGDIKHDGFIAVKNDDRGILNISGGTITTTGDTETHTASAVQNWATATITGGTINGTVWTSVWSKELPASVTTIENATVTGKIVVKPYSNDLSVKPTLEIKSGTYKVSGWDVQGNGVVAISGGTFNAPVKPEYCVPNHEPVKNSNGTYTVTHFNVAEIGGTEYETLQKAFDAVNATGTIELLHDVTVTKTLTFNKDYSESPTLLKMNGYTITGDGCRALQIVNGHLRIEGGGTPEEGKNVITSTGIATASSVIRVGDGDHRQARSENMKSPELDIAAGVTVKAVCSYGITVFGYGEEKLTVNGNVISTATTNASYDGCAISTVGDDKTTANVTINGGTITAENTNAIYMPSGNLLVYSGAIVRGLTGIYAKSGNVQIKGAKIYGTGEAKGYSYHGNGGIPTGDALVLDSCGYPNGAPKVNYEGAGDAYFESTNAKPIGSYARDGYTKVTGFVDKGTFNKAIDKDLLAGGYVCVYNAETDNYGVATTENCVAKVGDIYYTALQDAIDAAQNGATVVLVKDVDTPEVSYVIDKSLTIDLNGKTVTGSGYDGVFHITGKDANVVINGTVAGSKVVAKEDKSYAMAVWANAAGCTVTLNDGDYGQTITGTDNQYDMIYTSAGTIIINSGSFESRTSKWTLNCLDAAYKAGTANIIVNGGTFKGFDPMNGETEGKGTSFVNAEKYVGVNAAKNDDGTVSYSAVENMTAQVMDADGKSVQAYKKLSDALADAKDGQTVKLLKSVNGDVTGEKYVEVEANVTLDLNGHDLTGAKLLWVTGTILDSATKKGIVSATKYLLPTNNGYAPVYNSTTNGYSFFELNVFSAKTESGSGVWFRLGKSTERAAAVELMKQNANGRRIKAIVTVSWENGEEGSGKQSFEFADGKMGTYLTAITQYVFEVNIGGLNRISGKVTAQAQFVVYDAEGSAIYTIAGNNWIIQE